MIHSLVLIISCFICCYLITCLPLGSSYYRFSVFNFGDVSLLVIIFIFKLTYFVLVIPWLPLIKNLSCCLVIKNLCLVIISATSFLWLFQMSSKLG